MKLFGLPVDKLSIIPYGLELEKFQNDDVETYEPFFSSEYRYIDQKKRCFSIDRDF